MAASAKIWQRYVTFMSLSPFDKTLAIVWDYEAVPTIINSLGHLPEVHVTEEEFVKSKEEMTQDSEGSGGAMLYDIPSNPPIHITLVYALQLLLSNIGGTLACVYLVHANLCAGDNDLLFADLLATGIFMSGFCTLLQTTFGCRLPIYQGGARSFIPALAAVMATKQHLCEGQDQLANTNMTWMNNSSLESNETIVEPVVEEEIYVKIINEVSGSLALAALFQVVVGFTGLVGALMTFVGPLTIAPIVTLIGLSLTRSTNLACQHHWGIAFLTIILVYVFSIMMEKITVPVPVVNLKGKCQTYRTPVFKIFPQILALAISWILCGILTATDYIPDDKSLPHYKTRTDAKIQVLHKVRWFTIPYPGRWGAPTISVGTTLGFLAAIIASIIDTAGDYYATSRACGMPPPPRHAVNRGIFVDGIGRVCSGLVGACHATASYSTPIGFITLTGVSSRLVWQVSAIMIMIMGVVGKITGCISLVPDPVIGGLAAVGLMVLVGVALSNLYCVDLNSARNQVVLGTSLMLGLMVPEFIRGHPGCIQTGNKNFDQVLTIMLSTGMCVGGAVAAIMDNILPGTPEERGMITFSGMDAEVDSDPDSTTHAESSRAKKLALYEFPLISNLLKRNKWTSYFPVSPTFTGMCNVNVIDRIRRRVRDRKTDHKATTTTATRTTAC